MIRNLVNYLNLFSLGTTVIAYTYVSLNPSNLSSHMTMLIDTAHSPIQAT